MSDSDSRQAGTRPPLAWSVWRMDDNGNRFLVRDQIVARDEAERMATEFTARGHKQVYWVEPQPSQRQG